MDMTEEIKRREYLVDVPVQINIWTRPACQKKQLEVLQKARPAVLFLVSDGGRGDQEWEAIRANRALLEQGIDWQCTVHRLYEEENIGIKRMIVRTHEFVWARVDRCIFLEDDIIPAVSFFRYCKELLEKYESDERISVICGMNHLGEYAPASADYFFSRQGSIWGYALWRRTYEEFYRYGYENDPYTWDLLQESLREDRFLRNAVSRIRADKERQFSAMEFFMELSIHTRHQLMIVPKRNMICCMGANESANGADSLRRLPRAIRRLFYMQTWEIAFPLRHPEFVIPDGVYERARNRLVGRNHPVLTALRRVERGLYVLRDGDVRYLWKKLRK